MVSVLPFVIGPASASDIKVEVGGEPGSVAEAIALAQPGDRILVDAAEWNEPPLVVQIDLTIEAMKPGVVLRPDDVVDESDPPWFLTVSEGAVVTLTGLTFDCHGAAGGISVANATLLATDVELTGALLAGRNGAGLDAETATVTWVRGVISDAAGGARGGCVYGLNSTVVLDGVELDTCAAAAGAAVFVDGGDTTVLGSTIRSASGGSAVEAHGPLTFEASTVDASWSGTSLFVGGASTTVRGATFVASGASFTLLDFEAEAFEPTVVVEDSWFEAVATEAGPLVRFGDAVDGQVSGNYFCSSSANGVAEYTLASGRFQANIVQDVFGGGLVVNGGSVVATNNTLVASTSPTWGSAMALADGSIGLTATNNLIAWQTNATGAAVTGPVQFEYGLLHENTPDSLGPEVTGDASTNVVGSPGFALPIACDPAAVVPAPGTAPVDAGSPEILDADGTRSDIGASGGPEPNPFLPLDTDGDGFEVGDDCDDDDPLVHPDAAELGCNSRDDDCDPATADVLDHDADGHDCLTDCRDDEPGVHPGAEERCDGVDQDCDGLVDDDAVDAPRGWPDADGDGYGGPASSDGDCDAGSGVVPLSGDCDDLDGAVHPGATERADDGVDQDCDGLDLETTLGGAAGFPCGCRNGAGGALGAVLLALALGRRRR